MLNQVTNYYDVLLPHKQRQFFHESTRLFFCELRKIELQYPSVSITLKWKLEFVSDGTYIINLDCQSEDSHVLSLLLRCKILYQPIYQYVPTSLNRETLIKDTAF